MAKMSRIMINQIKPIVERVIYVIEKVTKFVCVGLMAVMVVIVTYGVFMRYVMLSAVSWSEEAPIWMMIWTAFLAGSMGIRHGVHVGVSIVIDQLPRRVSLAVEIFCYIIIIFFLIAVFKEGYFMTLSGFKYQKSMGLGLSMGWVLLSVPVGAALMIIECCYKILIDIDRLTKDNTVLEK